MTCISVAVNESDAQIIIIKMPATRNAMAAPCHVTINAGGSHLYRERIGWREPYLSMVKAVVKAFLVQLPSILTKCWYQVLLSKIAQ